MERFQQRVERAAKALICACLGAFGLIVGWTNIVDHQSNWQYVQRVLAMDAFHDWFDPAAIQGRAIAEEGAQRLFYYAIIAGEILMGALFMVAALLIARTVFSDDNPSLGKAIAVLGGSVGLLVWYFGFVVIGAQWFAMWASTYDAQMTAHMFSAFILIAMIYITRPE